MRICTRKELKLGFAWKMSFAGPTYKGRLLSLNTSTNVTSSQYFSCVRSKIYEKSSDYITFVGFTVFTKLWMSHYYLKSVNTDNFIQGKYVGHIFCRKMFIAIKIKEALTELTKMSTFMWLININLDLCTAGDTWLVNQTQPADQRLLPF